MNLAEPIRCHVKVILEDGNEDIGNYWLNQCVLMSYKGVKTNPTPLQTVGFILINGKRDTKSFVKMFTDALIHNNDRPSVDTGYPIR